MQTDKILIPAIVGTSAMTLFSYSGSGSEKKNFREPEILGKLIHRLSNRCSKESAEIAGWSIHYVVGILFMVFYKELWEQKKIKPSLASGALLGAASGLVGIIGWKTTYKVHPNPPAKNLKNFFYHLVLAHVIFGIFCSLAYKLALAHKNS